MRLIRSLVPAALAVATILVASQSGRANSAGDAPEIRRIRTHFDSVLTGLTARDLGALSAEQVSHRQTLLTTLRAYRERGVFPHNYDFPGQFVPYFVDRKTGTLCAVAYLLESTGRRDIVDRVAKTNNTVWVAQLAGDTAFTNWLSVNGISLDEAAFIQVPYAMVQTPAERNRQTAFIAVAPFALGGALITGGLNALGNADGHRTTVSKVGVVTGVTTAVMGSLVMAKADNSGIGGAAIAVGLTTVALSARSMIHHSTIVAQREAEQRARSAVQTSLAPIVSTSNGGSAGMQLSVRF
ncbi:MAG: hypothetical protein ABI625_07755 [bacterium]